MLSPDVFVVLQAQKIAESSATNAAAIQSVCKTLSYKTMLTSCCARPSVRKKNATGMVRCGAFSERGAVPGTIYGLRAKCLDEDSAWDWGELGRPTKLAGSPVKGSGEGLVQRTNMQPDFSAGR
ncbi:MAG TPA: hypothetical protein VLC92_09200 [Rhodocyclaceae bacterium]|nr:hypothetical protein [Rhodocyclaceae bacterium]